MSSFDPQNVLQTLSVVAAGQAVDELTSGVCQRIFGKSDISSSARLLASDLVHAGVLHDVDWETVTRSIKDGISSTDSDSQVLSLLMLPSLPTQYLTDMVIQDDVGDFVLVCLNDRDTDLRAAALSALGHILAQASTIKSINERQEKMMVCEEYCSQICEYLIDSDDQTAGSAYRAVKTLLERKRVLEENDTISPCLVLIQKWCSQCCSAIRTNLSAIVHRIGSLDVANLIPAMDVLFVTGMASLSGDDVGIDGSKTTMWIVSVIGRFLQSRLSSTDIAVVHQSAAYLLQICEECLKNESKTWGVLATSSLSSWSSQAIDALENLLESKESVPARGDILLVTTQHLQLLEVTSPPSTTIADGRVFCSHFRSIDRTRSLMHLWRAVVKADLKLRKIYHSRSDVASLRSILEDPFFSGVVTGQQKPNTDQQLQKAISRASYSAYKQELVSTLMEVLAEYGRAFVVSAVFAEKHVSTQEVPRNLSLQSAIQADVQEDVIDWFESSVEALFLTQACLGWDNNVTEGHYGLTLPADLWLQQLQVTTQTLYTILAHYDIHFLVELQAMEQETETPTRLSKVLKQLAGEVFEIQKLMKRMVFFWSFLNTALKPRVFWIVSHHIQLPDKVDDMWNYLIDSLKDLLLTRPLELANRQQDERIEAGRQGKLASTNDYVYNTKSADHSKTPDLAFTHSEVCHEGMTVGLVCLGKMVETLTDQFRYEGFEAHYADVKEIAERLKSTCTQVLDEDYLTVDMFDQCKSVIKRLDFIIENPPQNATEHAQQSGDGVQGTEHSVTFLLQDLRKKCHGGYPFSNTLGFATNKRARRHKALRWNLLKSIEDVRPKMNKSPAIPPIPERPTPVELAAAVGGLNLKEDERGWTILTGQGDPVQLSIRHQIDAFNRILEVEISAENKMGTSDVTGVVVSFAIEGPVEADREGLIVWHPEKLPANAAVMHCFELTLSEFGAIEIQPFMDVALQGSEEEMPALSCSSYSIPLVDLIIPVSMQPSAEVYVQEVASWPESLRTTAVCRWSGTNGAMQLLSALKQSRLHKIWPQKTYSLGILQAVYIMQTFNDAWISLAITGQLVDLQRMGLAAWVLPSESTSAGNTGYYLCKCTFTSASAHAIASIRAQTAELLADLSGGGLALGLDPGVGRPPPPPPIDPDLFIDVGNSESSTFIPDMASLALEEWKRLN